MSDKSENIKDNSPEQLEDSFDLAGLLLEYLANWKWFVLSVILCIIAAHYYIATIVPTYEVTASIYLNGDDANSKTNAVTMSDEALINMKQFLDETELEIMKSRNNMMRVVDSLGLSYQYAEVGRLRDEPLYNDNPISVKLDTPYLAALETSIVFEVTNGSDGAINFDLALGDGIKRFEVKQFPDTLLLEQGPLIVDRKEGVESLSKPLQVCVMPQKWAAARVAGGLSVQFAENSFTIVRINYHTPIINEGKDVINAMIKFYNDDIIADKNRSAIQTEAFIVDRLRMIADDLKSVENQLEQYQRENNAVALEGQVSMNMAQMQAANNELVSLGTEQGKLQEAKRIVQRTPEYDEIGLSGFDPSVDVRIAEYNKKVQAYKRFENLGDEIQGKKDLQSELRNLRSGIISTIDLGIKDYDRKIKAVSGQAGKAAAGTSVIPTKEKGLQEIFRDQQVKVNIYTFLLQKREEIALQKTLATPTARLIDDPSGSGPVSPQATSIYGIAILIGVIIPAALIYLRRLIFPVFKDKDELERATKVPVLSEISKIRKPEHIVIKSNDTSPEAELFRLLRNNIQFILGKGKVMLVTSSLSGEGKTFIASNIAMSFALTGKRTLVVGMDIRRPVLAHSFGMSNREGITTFLCGQTDDWESLVQPSTENDNLYVMPAGPVPPNPNELLLSHRLDEMMEQAREIFDYIIIDSAPIGLVSDSLLVARVSDVQLYVTRASYSTRRCIKMMHQTINSGRFPHTYLILNGVNMRSNAYRYRRYGTYGSYHSQGNKGYGYGYQETPKPMSRIKKMWRKARRK